MIFSKITLKLIIHSPNIWRRLVGWVPNNVSPSNIFLILLLFERYHQKHKAVLAAPGINRLKWKNILILRKHVPHRCWPNITLNFFEAICFGNFCHYFSWSCVKISSLIPKRKLRKLQVIIIFKWPLGLLSQFPSLEGQD